MLFCERMPYWSSCRCLYRCCRAYSRQRCSVPCRHLLTWAAGVLGSPCCQGTSSYHPACWLWWWESGRQPDHHTSNNSARPTDIARSVSAKRRGHCVHIPSSLKATGPGFQARADCCMESDPVCTAFSDNHTLTALPSNHQRSILRTQITRHKRLPAGASFSQKDVAWTYRNRLGLLDSATTNGDTDKRKQSNTLIKATNQ